MLLMLQVLSQQGISTTKEVQGCNPILHRHRENHEDMKHRLASYCHYEMEKLITNLQS